MKYTIISIMLGLLLASDPLAVSAEETQAAAEDECAELDGMPPGLYVTVDENQVYLIKGDKIVELDPGEAAYASETDLSCLKLPPRTLNWPCNTAESLSRPMAAMYAYEDLPAFGAADEVKRRYFEDDRVLGPQIEWINGETHGRFDAAELAGFDTSGYWYLPADDDPFDTPKRPRSQLVALFWATRQALLDPNTFERLNADSEDGAVPVVFVYPSDHEVPVSFFGEDVSLQELLDAYFKEGIEVAPVPVWYVGDHHLKVNVSEFEKLFDIPSLDDIPPQRAAALRTDLETNGFAYKPIIVNVMGERGIALIDQPERVRVAASMGMTRLPAVLFYFSASSHLAGCGVTAPQVSVVASATGDITPVPPPPLPDPEQKISGN